MDDGSFGSCASTPRMPAAAPSSRTSGQRPDWLDVPSARPRSPRRRLATRPRPGLLRDDMDCAESWPERAGRGRVHVAQGDDTNARDTKTTRTRSAPMRLKARLCLTVAAIGLAALLAAAPAQLSAQTAVAIDDDDIGGVVTGGNGPEAGVWVIAETTDLPTRYIKSVVTDDQGRYVIPDLPTANYEVWVRGYGLVDSPKMRAKPGQIVNLTNETAPNEKEAAHYYPAIYWFTMMKLPPASDFGGTTNIPKNITQETWRQRMNNVDCVGCHQLGQEATRTIPAQFGHFKSGEEAWMRRIQSGQAGEMMTNRLAGQLGGAPYKYFGDWTDRVAKGELPKHKPPRPQGIERNVVVTAWEWSTPDKYLHDLISSDRRKPTVNANGPLYGSPEYSTDNMPILDPKTNKVTFFKMPVEDPNMPESLGPGHAASIKPLQASAYWGDEKLWDTRANNHNAMFDDKGRVWIAAAVRGMGNPAFCKKGSDHPSAKVFPLDRSPAGSTPAYSRRPATPRRRKAGRRSCLTPTVMASSTNTPTRASRGSRARTRASRARVLTP